MMVCLLGLLRTERLANDMSAVTRVMDILKEIRHSSHYQGRYKEGRTAVAPVLTCPQTCVSENQTMLSASCLSPKGKRSGMR